MRERGRGRERERERGRERVRERESEGERPESVLGRKWMIHRPYGRQYRRYIGVFLQIRGWTFGPK